MHRRFYRGEFILTAEDAEVRRGKERTLRELLDLRIE